MSSLPETVSDTLPELAHPVPGHYFPDHRDARDYAQRLNAVVLEQARLVLEEAYKEIAKLRNDMRHPLPGMTCATNSLTARVLDDLLKGLVDADGESVGFALGRIDEEFAWRDAILTSEMGR